MKRLQYWAWCKVEAQSRLGFFKKISNLSSSFFYLSSQKLNKFSDLSTSFNLSFFQEIQAWELLHFEYVIMISHRAFKCVERRREYIVIQSFIIRLYGLSWFWSKSCLLFMWIKITTYSKQWSPHLSQKMMQSYFIMITGPTSCWCWTSWSTLNICWPNVKIFIMYILEDDRQFLTWRQDSLSPY